MHKYLPLYSMAVRCLFINNIPNIEHTTEHHYYKKERIWHNHSEDIHHYMSNHVKSVKRPGITLNMMLAPPCITAPFQFQVEHCVHWHCTVHSNILYYFPQITCMQAYLIHAPVFFFSLLFLPLVNIVPKECAHGGIKTLWLLMQRVSGSDKK